MENTKHKKPEKTLSKWMIDEDLSDIDLGDSLEVRRETVWRWRTKGHLPRQRERKKIIAMAGCKIIFGGTDGTH